MEAARKHGFQVYGAPTSDSIAAIKDISLATAKALTPTKDHAALASIIDNVSSYIASEIGKSGKTPTDVFNAAIQHAVPNNNFRYAARPLPVNYGYTYPYTY